MHTHKSVVQIIDFSVLQCSRCCCWFAVKIYKMKEGGFRLEMRKTFFTAKVVRP